MGRNLDGYLLAIQSNLGNFRIHMVNLRSIDLNLLTVFEVVYEERSQIHAAQRLGMTQPAVSNALGRLRHLVGDRLFQGRTKGLIPTAKADDLYSSIHSALDTIRAEMETRTVFDPTHSQRTFVITTSFGGALIGLPLFQRMRELGPRLRCVLRTIDPDEEIPNLLRERRVDLAIHHARLDDTLLEQNRLVSYSAVIVARKGHPEIEAAIQSKEGLMGLEFVVVHDHSRGLAQNPDMRPIIELFRERVALEVPSTTMLPLAVAQTDLVAFMSRQMAEMASKSLGLKYYATPFPIPEAPMYVIWHPARREDPAHVWLRQQCMALVKEWD